MKNVKVPLFGNPGKSATIDAEATNGAVVGKNLFNLDGSVVTAAQLSGSASQPSSSNDLTTSDDLDEGSYNIYFTTRRAQDAVGSILADTADIDFSYTAGASITAALKPTGVIAGTYGDATHAVVITVDAKGRITSISEEAIEIPVSQSLVPVVTGEAPPVFVYLDDGSLVFVEAD